MKKTYTTFSRSILVTLFLLVNVYFVGGQCMPSNIGDTNKKGISNFTLTGDSGSEINHDSGVQEGEVGQEGYINYTSKSINVTIGNTYDFTATNSVSNGTPTASMGIWIDYDGNGNYELVYDSGVTSNNYTFSGSITINGTAPDTAVMRIATVYCYNNAGCQTIPATPCDFNNELAEIEDYTLNFLFPDTPEAFDDELLVVSNSSGTNNQINLGHNDNISVHRGDGDDFSIVSSPTHGNVTEVFDGTFEYVPDTDYVGNDSFTYNICDSNGNCDTATVNLTVNLGACEPISETNGSVYITNVSLAGESTNIYNASGDDGGYGNYLNIAAADLLWGSTYTVSISGAGAPKSRALYIDYNKDGLFDNSEFISVKNKENISFTIPNDAIEGTTVMRVGVSEPTHFQSNSCGVHYDLQEFEDYFVTIGNTSVSPSPPTPTVYPDTDGDGITDNIDLDDDNDGVLDDDENNHCNTNPHATVAKTVFLYETFGTGTSRVQIDENFSAASTDYEFSASGNVVDGKYTVYHNAQDIASWADEYWYKGDDFTPNDSDGRMAIFNAETTPGGVFYENQITGVTPNVTVTYSFAAINLDRKDDDSRSKPKFLMEIIAPDGTVIADKTTDAIGGSDNTGWVINELTFIPTTSDFTVRLSNLVSGGLGNDLALDDILVEQLFCDSDGDGIANSIDLDDDNDGIPTVVELGLSDTDKDGTLLGDGWTDSDNNGVHDSYESGATLVNSDSDTVPNYLDLDSDNDGVFDAYEYDGLGDIDITGNGVGDGTDSDGDGILDSIEDKDGFGFTTYNAAVETTSGTPNYLNTQSGGTNDILAISHLYPGLVIDANGAIDDHTDSDGDGILDAFDTDTSTFGSPRDITGSFALYFDGLNDYVEEPSFMSDWAEATLMCWIKIDDDASGTRFIMGQDNFYMELDDANYLHTYGGGKSLQSDEPLPTGIWVHVVARFGDKLWLYTNGDFSVEKIDASGNLETSNSSFSIGRTPDTDNNYFKGEIDEVRVFNEALNSNPIRRMVYQELDENNFNYGKIIPKQIDSNLSTQLQRYYKLDDYQNDKLKDHTGNNTVGATIYNVKDILPQTAPLPFVTFSDKSWETKGAWLHGDVWDISHTDATNQSTHTDWVIVNIAHNITTTASHNTLGVLIDNGAKLTVGDSVKDDDYALENNWYLNIEDSGKIELIGDSQLVQTKNSTLGTGTGTLERDQQGESNKHNYNYWSSPVNSGVNGDGDKTYTVASVLRDGTDENDPKTINFIGGYNGVKGDPISIAEYWIWKYANNKSDTYALWQHTKSNGEIEVGEGYTMKGPGQKGVNNTQNFTFIGMPNNGDITLPINAGNEYLVGNPYPSAIDAYQFLDDNKEAIDGTIYLWEHYGGDSHYSVDYEGGYGSYNYSGGTPAMTGTAPDEDLTHANKSKKTPGRYISVAQGFFVKAAETQLKTTVTFKNSQRIFVKEDNSNSIFIKESTTKTAKEESPKYEDLRPKIRIDYTSPKGYVRQLLTTVDKKASIGYDWGYDGLLNETNIEDMYWKVANEDYIIQGIDTITKQTVLPFTVKTKSGGLVEISINALENLPNDVDVYVKDYDTYHDLRAASFFANVPAGETYDRFEITFTNESSTLDVIEESTNALQLFYNTQNANLVISNPNANTIETLKAVNTLGQVVFETAIQTSDRKILVPTNLATGMHIFSIQTNQTEVTKKVIVAE
ncbi:cadherin-like domain-containing protein [Tamlana agarivorans]|uniref:Cadherin-like domain-containing protein n=1 Tax=Pseudotamlana agarivorans TaxID=481183 RepID=A0ACC5U818_9FLAO|nr:LamG-like jellyroll fold domain-containing protein [Tamlana agarivorans]MBU2950454.1 cadherin-like domain-containing protein [Tamlana agarivorans]